MDDLLGNQALVGQLAVASGNLEVLLLAPKEDQPELVRELFRRWPQRVKTFLIQHQRFDLLNQLPTDFQQRDLVTALRTGRLGIIKYLHDHGLALPAQSLDLVAGTGDVEVLEWLYYHRQRPTEVAITEAARAGRLGNLKWLRRQGVLPTPDALVAAAYGGHVEVLEYLLDLGLTPEPRVAVAAARGRHLPTLQWLYRHGVEFNATVYTLAVASGDQRLVDFLKSLPGDSDGSLAENDLDSLGLGESGVDLTVRMDVVRYAAQWGQLAVVQQYFDPQYADNGGALAAAINHGHDEVAKWLLSRGVSFHRMLIRAAECGRLAVVEAMVQTANQAHQPLDYQRAIVGAIEYGHLAVARRLVDHQLTTGQEVSGAVLAAAVHHGQWELEAWLLERGVAVDEDVLRAYLITGRFDRVDQLGLPERLTTWLRALSQEDLAQLLGRVARDGSAETLTELTRLGVQFDEWLGDTLYFIAAEHGRLSVVEWLIDHGVPVGRKDLDVALRFAVINGYLSVMERLMTTYWPDWRLEVSEYQPVGYLEVVQRVVDDEDAPELLESSVYVGYRALVEEAIRRGQPITGRLLDLAAIRGHLTLLAWLYGQTRVRCSRGAYRLAKELGRQVVVRFLARAGFDRQRGAWFDYNDYESAAETEDVTDDSLEVRLVTRTPNRLYYDFETVDQA